MRDTSQEADGLLEEGDNRQFGEKNNQSSLLELPELEQSALIDKLSQIDPDESELFAGLMKQQGREGDTSLSEIKHSKTLFLAETSQGPQPGESGSGSSLVIIK